jgi:pimeloyl-ACP methyl ester carboxylesterase
MSWYIFGAIVLLVAGFLIVRGIQLHFAMKIAEQTLANFHAKAAQLSYGKMTYVDAGKSGGPVLFCVHGIFGGYDQGYNACAQFADQYRIIAPSRFGYLGSDIKGDGSPREQATAFVELLDKLKIQKVTILGTSAGGTPAIRFALDYPQRTAGLILYSSAMPYDKKPTDYVKYAGPPPFLVNNYAMWLMSPLFPAVMGMSSDTIDLMLPVSARKVGIDLDAKIVNPDMAKNFADYPIEKLAVPTLILAAKDDKLVKYSDVERARPRFKSAKYVIFNDGGHLLAGHEKAVKTAVVSFINGEK